MAFDPEAPAINMRASQPAAEDEAPEARRVASSTLGHLRHPAALGPLQHELADLGTDAVDRESHWAAPYLSI